jgi:hypothetical protein
MRWPLGQPVYCPTTVRDRTGALVDAGTLTLVVKLLQADGTWTTTGTYSTPTHDSTGTYHQDIPAADVNTIGHYQYAVVTTGAGAGVQPGDFDVFDPFETAVLPLADAKDQLNIPQTTTTSDSEIQSWIATIETSMEAMTGGPLVNRAITERAEMLSNQTVILVRQRPLVLVTQILSANGTPIDISGGLDYDPVAGAVRRKLGLPFYGPFFSWLPQVTVTYTAGWGTSVPAAFGSAARVILQHLWDSQRGAAPGPVLGGTELVIPPGFSFAIPNRAAELLDGSLNGMPFRSEAFV